MNATHEIPTALRSEIVLLERKAEDLKRIADTLATLRAHHVGQILVGIPPKLYVENLRTLTQQAGALLQEK